MIRQIGTTICVLILATVSAAAGPRSEISETAFDFGFVPQNAAVSHPFFIRSVGDMELKIDKVIPGCGCTQVPMDKTAVSPGDSARMEIVFHTKTYRGSVSKAPSFVTNESPDKHLIQFQARVVTQPDSTYPVIVRPYKLDLSETSEAPRTEMSFEIVNVSERPVELTMISSPDELAEVHLPRIIRAGETVTGTLALTPEGVGQNFEKSFTFELDDAARSRFTVPIKRKMDIQSAKIISTGSK